MMLKIKSRSWQHKFTMQIDDIEILNWKGTEMNQELLHLHKYACITV